jgi:hypothetical protein
LKTLCFGLLLHPHAMTSEGPCGKVVFSAVLSAKVQLADLAGLQQLLAGSGQSVAAQTVQAVRVMIRQVRTYFMVFPLGEW